MGPATPIDMGPPDTGVVPDLGPPDMGMEPLPCLWDQGGEANRGCPSGMVCNVDTGMCTEGKSCTSNDDCNACSRLQNPEQCGHGYPLTAWCDPNHGSVCTRSRAPCEPCNTDSECGVVDSILRRNVPNEPELDQNRCLDYDGDGAGDYCGRPNRIGCPPGFLEDQDTSQCVREQGCAEEPVICPRSANPGVGCPGREQICPGDVCPDTGGGLCSTNDLPGSLGLCIGFCRTDADCPADRPVCNPDNGICGAGCTKGSCAPPLVCHVDGFCAAPCMGDDDCTMSTAQNLKIYGTDLEVYCNLPGRDAPRLYKGGNGPEAYRDDMSCAPLGCERPTDCPSSGRVCDSTLNPPACVEGCFTAEDDCPSGFQCKSGPQGNYNREACRALPGKTNESEIGVCCFPGCTDRDLQCGGHQFCCGETGSPYEDPNACPSLTQSSTVAAQGGECFEMVKPPFCVDAQSVECNSAWTVGFNSDPMVNGGIPFQEQEFAFGVDTDGDMMADAATCGVTCNPTAPDSGCPVGWLCTDIHPGCLQDADCGGGGLTCVGANTTAMPPIPGDCKCGEDGVAAVTCPTAYGGPGAQLGTIENPRCQDVDGDGIGDMRCVAAYNCIPPSIPYPMSCF
ncbi:MAG: hypothetical protein AAFZ18_14665 [Myxococcota bacterium]